MANEVVKAIGLTFGYSVNIPRKRHSEQGRTTQERLPHVSLASPLGPLLTFKRHVHGAHYEHVNSALTESEVSTLLEEVVRNCEGTWCGCRELNSCPL